MKTLANCTPREFLVQTNRIRKHVANWLELTKVLEIRKRPPVFPEGATEEEKKEISREQAKENIYAMMDAAMEEHAKETAELIGLLCFIEPEDLDNHKPLEFVKPIAELLDDEDVIGFFTSLMRLERKTTLQFAAE